MPVVPKANFSRGIRGTPTPADLNNVGAGAVYDALSNVGGAAKDVANDFLMREKIAQSNAFSQGMAGKKKTDSKAFRNDLWKKVNRSTGRVKNLETGEDTDQFYYDAVKEWEDEQTEDIIGKAPTEMAKQDFLNIDRRDTPLRLLSSHKLQYETVRANYKTDTIERRGEEIKSNASSPTKGRVDRAIEDQNSFVRNITSDVGVRIDDEQGHELIRLMGRKSSISTVDSAFSDGDIRSVAEMIEMERLLSTKAGQAGFIEAASKNFTLSEEDKKNTEVIWGALAKRPDIKAAFLSTSRDGVTVFRDFEGNIVDDLLPSTQVTKSLPQFIDESGRPINLSGDFTKPPNEILKYLTPEDQIRFAFRLLKLQKTNKKKRDLALVNEAQDWEAGLKSTDPLVMKRVGDSEITTAAYDTFIANVQREYIDDPVRKSKILTGVFAARAAGEVIDGTVLENPRAIEAMMGTITRRIERDLEEAGIPAGVVTATAVKVQAVNHVKAAVANARRQLHADTSEYLMGKDPALAKDWDRFATSSDMVEQKAAMESYFERYTALADGAGVPRHISDRNVLPKAFIKSQAFMFTEALRDGLSLVDPNNVKKGTLDGGAKLMDAVNRSKFVFGQKHNNVMERIIEEGGLPEYLKFFSIIPSDKEGLGVAMTAMQALASKQFNEKGIEAKERQEIRKKVHEKMGELTKGLMEGNFSGITRESSTYLTEIADAMALHLVVSEGYDQNSAIRVATNRVKDMYVNINTRNASVTVSKEVIRSHGGDPENNAATEAALRVVVEKPFVTVAGEMEVDLPFMIKNIRGEVGAEKYDKLTVQEKNVIGFDILDNLNIDVEVAGTIDPITAEAKAYYRIEGSPVRVPIGGNKGKGIPAKEWSGVLEKTTTTESISEWIKEVFSRDLR